MKTAFDHTTAFIGLLLTAPIIAALMFAIRCTSKGPALFIQDRVGKDGAVFRCYKLRTMYIGTVNVPTHMVDANQTTPFGFYLRKAKIDELPQLWNILCGEMSFVGPRPCLPSQKELMEERRRRGVLALLPGVTGLAQVEGIDMSDPVRLAEKDSEYLRKRSFTTDLKLIWRTIALGTGQGGRAPNAQK